MLPLSRLIESPTVSITARRWLSRRDPKPGKPPILPPAKKVLYRVVRSPWMEPTHVKELLWRRQAYNNAVSVLRQLFAKEIEAKEAAGLGIEALKAREKEELDALIAENEAYNKERTRLRESRENEEYEELKSQLLDDIKIHLEKKKEVAKASQVEVQKAIKDSVNFVTRENLEQRISEALDNPTVYDYCIDLKGNKFYDPAPMKYVEGTPTRQKGRVFDRSLLRSQSGSG